MCTFKSILKFILDSASVVRVIASSNIALEGDAYTLGCEATGDPMPPTVTWIKVSNNQRIHGNILEFTSIDRNDAGDYKCEARNRCGMEAKTETISVSCKYCIVSIWLWFMRKYSIYFIYYITCRIMYFKKGKDCVRKALRMKTLKKKDLKTNLYKCVVVNIFLVFFSFKTII